MLGAFAELTAVGPVGLFVSASVIGTRLQR
nr:hypothetical protein CPGR_04182 [Mycolicibacterium malmesburyense]